MKIHNAVSFCLSLTFIAAHASAESIAISNDGKEIILKDNGQWQYQQAPTSATLPDGRKVELLKDGQWHFISEEVGNRKQTPQPVAKASNAFLNARFNDGVIETKTTKFSKAIRYTTQMVFNITLDASKTNKNVISISKQDISKIKVTDESGKSYRLLHVEGIPASIEPGNYKSIEIRVSGSPGLLNSSKTVNIDFETGFAGVQDKLGVIMLVSNLKEKSVYEFEYE